MSRPSDHLARWIAGTVTAGIGLVILVAVSLPAGFAESAISEAATLFSFTLWAFALGAVMQFEWWVVALACWFAFRVAHETSATAT